MGLLVLAGDVGGTKVNLALVDVGQEVRVVTAKSFPSQKFSSFGAIVDEFFAENSAHVQAACIGVAGPVIGNRVNVTNLPWIVDGADIQRRGVGAVWLVNDIVAYASGIETLQPDGLVTLQAGQAKMGNRALIAAGTGLGECGLIRDEALEKWLPSPSEGGHVDFSPTSDEDIELLKFLRTKYQRVSWERLLSGKFGFHNLVTFRLKHHGHQGFWQEAVDQEKDLGPLVTARAHEGDAFALAVVQTFCRLYGSEAGNLALKFLALGGVYVGGGIAQHLMPWLKQQAFTEAFSFKGRFSDLVAAIPVHVITDPEVALKGAALFAARGLK